MSEKTLERRKNDRYTIHVLLIILGLLMGYVGQGERLRPLIHGLNITVAENKKDISHIYEKIDEIHEYIQTQATGK